MASHGTCLTVLVALALISGARSSLDDIFMELREEFIKKEEVMGKSDIPSWDDYQMDNRTESFVIYNFDMIIEKETFFQMMDQDGGRAKRGAGTMTQTRLWPRTIPYEIDSSFEFEWRVAILKAMQHVMQHTCVVFAPRQDETNYIKFIRTEFECSSHVGMMLYENQIKLAVPQCGTMYAIVHEICHALGLYHEHMRHERDTYVTVFYGNVSEEDKSKDQFKKLVPSEYSPYGTPYDYLSIMHYGKNFLAKKENGTKLVTMRPTDEDFLDIMGKSTQLSFFDAMALNAMYECAAGCQLKECMQGGFLGKNCECFCAVGRGESVEPCSQLASCRLPDSEDYLFFDLFNTANNLTAGDLVPHGSKVEISYRNSDSCGNVPEIVRCQNGVWIGRTELSCIQTRCAGNVDWRAEYDISTDYENPDPDNFTWPHGHQVWLTCDSNIDFVSTLTCNNGKWRGQRIPCTGRNCSVVFSPGKQFVYQIDDFELEHGTTVAHGKIVEVRCRSLEANNVLATNRTCLDGQWQGKEPRGCPPVWSQCPVIPDAKVESDPLQLDMYKVHCLPGYEKVKHGTSRRLLNTQFTCGREGRWDPATPACQPEPCEVPAVNNGRILSSGDLIPTGSTVPNGTYIELVCGPGHIPDRVEITCKLGNWDIMSFPRCTKVTCDSPEVQGTTYSPSRIEHLYGDEVEVAPCRGNRELTGQRVLKCLKNGTWSSSASCDHFCKGGQRGWSEKRTYRFTKNGFEVSVRHLSQCKKRCNKEKRFLCLAISTGFDVSSGKYMCHLYKEHQSSKPELVERDIRWIVAERTCQRRVKTQR